MPCRFTRLEPKWARFIDRAYVFGEIANAFRDIGQPKEAAEYARRSIRAAKAQNRARRGALSHAALAAAHIQSGELEAAHAAGIRTLELSRRVKSSRSVEAVHDVRRRMQKYGNHRLVTDFRDRVHAAFAALPEHRSASRRSLRTNAIAQVGTRATYRANLMPSGSSPEDHR